MQTIRDALRLRKMHGKSLAKALGVTPTQVSRILSSGRTSEGTAEKMVKVLRISPESLRPPGQADQMEARALQLFRSLDTDQKSRAIVALLDLLKDQLTNPALAQQSKGAAQKAG